MRVLISPARLTGTLPAIPSKSDAHRLLICAALADAPTRLVLPDAGGEDIAATIRCLRAMGAEITRETDGLSVTPVRVPGEMPSLDCGESGSTLRFLLPLVAALGCGAVVTGRGRLPERPIGPLLDALREGGCVFDGERLPLRVEGRLRPGAYRLPGDISSQFVSGLLFALSRLPEGGTVSLTTPLESAGYVEMTRHALSRFAVEVRALPVEGDFADGEQGFCVPPGQRYRSPGRVPVEGDWSNAAFFLAAGALGGPVTLSGLSSASFQRDAGMLDALRAFGARTAREGERFTVGHGALRGGNCFSVREMPDLVPILAVVAAAAPEGETLLRDAGRLRIKESDRLDTVSQMLRALGAKVEEGPDFLRVTGGGLRGGGRVESHGDHRIAMAAAIAAAACAERTVLDGAEAVNKSYPSFFEDYRRLGGICDVVDDG